MAPLDDEGDAEPQEPAAPEQEDDEGDRGPDADGWLDLMDGKIRKRILKEGTGAQPDVKQDVRCTVEVRLADSSGKGAEPKVLQRYPNWRYRIGDSEAVPALELGLRQMREGEEAEIFGAANMAWGPGGLRAASPEEEPIPPNADVCLRVILHEVIAAAPPGQGQWNEMIQEIQWRKTNGNDFFKRQEYQKALRCYGAAVEIFNGEPPEHIDEKDRPAAMAAAMSLVTDCGANLAETHLQLGNPTAAKASARTAVDFSPEHVKALYRLARACLQLDEFDECEEALQRGLKVDAKNAALLQIEAELRHKQKKYEAKSKKVAAKVFDGLDYPNATEEAAKKKAAEKEAEPTWLQWAWQSFVDWFDWRVLAAMVVAAILFALVLAMLPKRNWPFAVIAFIILVPTSIGLLTSDKSDGTCSCCPGGKHTFKKKKN
mmetsp:Transcript_64106/g.185799  ORF Transcript_64106/g.185799 Transcript_64106/m.185799 type:complete len:431 (+) Transcript_64106:88-1380(+)